MKSQLAGFFIPFQTESNNQWQNIAHVLGKGLWEEVGRNAPEVYRKHCEERK